MAEVWFNNSCGIMARVPFISNNTDLVYENIDSIPIKITSVSLDLWSGLEPLTMKDFSDPFEIKPGEKLTLIAPILC